MPTIIGCMQRVNSLNSHIRMNNPRPRGRPTSDIIVGDAPPERPRYEMGGANVDIASTETWDRDHVFGGRMREKLGCVMSTG